MIVSQKIDRKLLQNFAWLSIVASLATMAIKVCAYLMTDSVGLLSDAIESIVNLIGGITALGVLKVALTPADSGHPYGHQKIEYFSSGFEGLLILGAAFAILWTSTYRLLHPQALIHLGGGLLFSFVATLINLVVGFLLIQQGRKHKSIALEADGQHLMTDVWTSLAVIVGLFLVYLTEWYILDPLVAILIALNILRTAALLIKRSYLGLMDSAIDLEALEKIENVMMKYRQKGISFHALKTRQAASRSFITVHFLVPGNWSVQDSHRLVEEFEEEVIKVLGDVIITTHLEPQEDEISLLDPHEE